MMSRLCLNSLEECGPGLQHRSGKFKLEVNVMKLVQSKELPFGASARCDDHCMCT